jgi:S-adenosylmethionine hydrolase
MKKTYRKWLAIIIALLFVFSVAAQNSIIVLQTDFGLKDGAVASMKGVMMQVDRNLQVFDLTHDIPAFNIWEAAFRLDQTAMYWPKGTIFVSVVDPSVGSSRKAIVVESTSGHFFVSPDNGSLTLIADHLGIKSVREINEKTNRLPGSEYSYTFHGRDIFAYTAARLAAKKITYELVGPLQDPSIQRIAYQKAIFQDGMIKGNIPVLDVQYGNVWSNIPESLIKQLNIKFNETLLVEIYENNKLAFSSSMPYLHTFSDVPEQQLLGYLNSQMNFSVAINMGNMAERYRIGSGPQWSMVLKRMK